MPVVTAIFVLIFGSLTFFLQDENFIKLKVTILYALFGSALIGALWFDKLLLPAVFELGLSSRRRRLAQAHLALEHSSSSSSPASMKWCGAAWRPTSG